MHLFRNQLLHQEQLQHDLLCVRKPSLNGALKVETPDLMSIPVENVAIPINVEIPVTFKSVKLLGPTLIACSIVLIVIASSDAIPLKRIPLSIISVVPMPNDLALTTPVTLISELKPENPVTNKSFIVPTPVITASVAPIPPLPPAFVAATCKV